MKLKIKKIVRFKKLKSKIKPKKLNQKINRKNSEKKTEKKDIFGVKLLKNPKIDVL